MGKRTPFYVLHVKANAKIVDFAGWDMPLHYGSQIKEHLQVREHVGMFDVSHMGIVDLHGPDVSAYLRYLLANNVDRLIAGGALYTCMLNESGGIIDDLIVYKIKDDFYRLVINAGTREKDIMWMRTQAKTFDIHLLERTTLAMLAIQGKEVKDKLQCFLLPDQVHIVEQLKPFNFTLLNDLFIARTGYTGEEGYELILPAEDGQLLWSVLLSAGIVPCGLGARDTLRLEAGLNLYGLDMDETVSPFEANLNWTVAMEPKERVFIGRFALERQAEQGVLRRLVGLVLEGPGIIRHHQKVMITGNGEGEVTSGGYSPTLEKSIALARVPSHIATQNTSPHTSPKCYVEIRNKLVPASIVKPPFVRHGQKMF